MGLMDRVKAQATQLAQQAQEAAQEGKARIDQAQAGRRGDLMLRQLGALVFAERTGRGTADSQARIDKLISDISAHESQNGLNLADPPQAGAGSGQPGSGQSGSGQPGFGQQSPASPGAQEQPDFPESPPASPGPADSPSGDPGAMPSVDKTTSFFSVPEDEPPGAPPQG